MGDVFVSVTIAPEHGGIMAEREKGEWRISLPPHMEAGDTISLEGLGLSYELHAVLPGYTTISCKELRLLRWHAARNKARIKRGLK